LVDHFDAPQTAKSRVFGVIINNNLRGFLSITQINSLHENADNFLKFLDNDKKSSADGTDGFFARAEEEPNFLEIGAKPQTKRIIALVNIIVILLKIGRRKGAAMSLLRIAKVENV
jgi:hypothetical protein